MKELVLLIFMICLIIDDYSIVFAKSQKKVKQSTDIIKNALESNLNVTVKKARITSEHGLIYITTNKELIFVKKGKKTKSKQKYLGEFEGLKAIRKTKTITVPRPIINTHTNNRILQQQQFIAMEYLNSVSHGNDSWAELGNNLADLHLCNLQQNCSKHPVTQFGFHVDTYFGHNSQNNTWNNDWIEFFVENRLSEQIERLKSRSLEDPRKTAVIEKYWPRLKHIIPKFFEGVYVKPSLLHGDLWTGNIGQMGSKPVLYDPAAFYGHYEYDIASTMIHGIYTMKFGEAYFKKVPKAKGFNKRMTLYHLHDFLKQWNRRKVDYADLVIDVCEKLLKNETEKAF